MTNKWRRIVCIIFYCVGIPWRLGVTAFFTASCAVILPFFYLHNLHQWACHGKDFEDGPWKFAKEMYVDFLIKGKGLPE